jgi:hypothetical protein
MHLHHKPEGDLQCMAKAMVENFELRNSLASLGIHKINLTGSMQLFLFLSMCGVDNFFFPVLLGRLSYGVEPSVVVYTD